MIKKEQDGQVGPSLLFFGCRNPQQDYIYEEELEEYAREGLTRLECAFSRLEGQPKRYVQHSLKAHEDEVWDLIEEGAIVYLCGDAGRMAPDVEKAFVGLYRDKTGTSEQDAETWMAGLKASQRYRVDVWPRNS